MRADPSFLIKRQIPTSSHIPSNWPEETPTRPTLLLVTHNDSIQNTSPRGWKTKSPLHYNKCLEDHRLSASETKTPPLWDIFDHCWGDMILLVLLLLPAVAILLVHQVRSYFSLKAFGGHWSAGWSRIWLLKTQGSGRMNEHFTTINRKYGEFHAIWSPTFAAPICQLDSNTAWKLLTCAAHETLACATCSERLAFRVDFTQVTMLTIGQARPPGLDREC